MENLVEKLVHCLQALQTLDSVGVIDKSFFPGVDGVIKRANEALAEYPELVPEWYSVKS